MSTETQDAAGKWIPLESNPEVMNTWAMLLGMSKASEFSDVYGLDPELLGLVPQPAKALIMCFPITPELDKAEKEVDDRISKDGQHPLDPSLVFIKQTIGNACGTMALLHAIGNSDVTIQPLSPLAKFFEEIQPLNPEERSEALTNTTLFAKAHETAATQGQSTVPNAQDDVDLHFVAFVEASSADPSPAPSAGADAPTPKRIVELDGRRPGPIDHGPSKNFLEDVAEIIRTKFIPYSTSANFGLISLGPPA